MWTASFMALGAQWMLGDVVGVQMVVVCYDTTPLCTDVKGTPMKPYILDFIDDGNINQLTERAVGGSYTNPDASSFDKVLNFSIAAAHVAWDIIGLLSGTFIFGFLYYSGVPLILVVGISLIYVIFLVRAILGYVRGV